MGKNNKGKDNWKISAKEMEALKHHPAFNQVNPNKPRQDEANNPVPWANNIPQQKSVVWKNTSPEQMAVQTKGSYGWNISQQQMAMLQKHATFSSTTANAPSHNLSPFQKPSNVPNPAISHSVPSVPLAKLPVLFNHPQLNIEKINIEKSFTNVPPQGIAQPKNVDLESPKFTASISETTLTNADNFESVSENYKQPKPRRARVNYSGVKLYSLETILTNHKLRKEPIKNDDDELLIIHTNDKDELAKFWRHIATKAFSVNKIDKDIHKANCAYIKRDDFACIIIKKSFLKDVPTLNKYFRVTDSSPLIINTLPESLEIAFSSQLTNPQSTHVVTSACQRLIMNKVETYSESTNQTTVNCPLAKEAADDFHVEKSDEELYAQTEQPEQAVGKIIQVSVQPVQFEETLMDLEANVEKPAESKASEQTEPLDVKIIEARVVTMEIEEPTKFLEAGIEVQEIIEEIQQQSKPTDVEIINTNFEAMEIGTPAKFPTMELENQESMEKAQQQKKNKNDKPISKAEEKILNSKVSKKGPVLEGKRCMKNARKTEALIPELNTPLDADAETLAEDIACCDYNDTTSLTVNAAASIDLLNKSILSVAPTKRLFALSGLTAYVADETEDETKENEIKPAVSLDTIGNIQHEETQSFKGAVMSTSFVIQDHIHKLPYQVERVEQLQHALGPNLLSQQKRLAMEKQQTEERISKLRSKIIKAKTDTAKIRYEKQLANAEKALTACVYKLDLIVNKLVQIKEILDPAYIKSQQEKLKELTYQNVRQNKSLMACKAFDRALTAYESQKYRQALQQFLAAFKYFDGKQDQANKFITAKYIDRLIFVLFESRRNDIIDLLNKERGQTQGDPTTRLFVEDFDEGVKPGGIRLEAHRQYASSVRPSNSHEFVCDPAAEWQKRRYFSQSKGEEILLDPSTWQFAKNDPQELHHSINARIMSEKMSYKQVERYVTKSLAVFDEYQPKSLPAHRRRAEKAKQSSFAKDQGLFSPPTKRKSEKPTNNDVMESPTKKRK